ncbi:MAG: hypothetical protein JXA89_21375, partial [Anaerolineae bacterium]|nr:hypothetical protein [Anaerolineae bacterium]
MHHRLLSIVFVVGIVLLSATLSVTHAAGEEYVEVFEGDMPLLFAVGHGGWKSVGATAIDSLGEDPLLRDYFYRVLAVRLYQKTGHLPYVVYQQGNRDYVNTNRTVGTSDAYALNNTEAQAAYYEFHDQVDAMIARIEDRYGQNMGLLINPHTTDLSKSRLGGPWDRIAEIGYIASVTGLGGTENTMRALYNRKGEVAVRGADSIPYQLFHGQDWPAASSVWPQAATENSKELAKTGDDVWHVLPAWVTGEGINNWDDPFFNGGKVARYHGTNTWGKYADWSNDLDAFQIEVNYTVDGGLALHNTDPEYDPSVHGYQLDLTLTTALMDDFIDAILHSLKVNYGWTPGGAYNVLIDNGDAGFGTTGSWAASLAEGSWGTPSVFSDDAGATATWTPTLNQAGTYEVLVRWTKVGARTTDARYTVTHASGSQTFSMDQSTNQDARWVSLGQFPFDRGGGGRVVVRQYGADSLSADAVLFRYIAGSSQVIVDNLDTGFTTTGTWHESGADGEYAGSSLYAGVDDGAGAVATWRPDLPQSGDYNV